MRNAFSGSNSSTLTAGSATAAQAAHLEEDERQHGCFAYEEELGESWRGYGAAQPTLNEIRPSL